MLSFLRYYTRLIYHRTRVGRNPYQRCPTVGTCAL